MKISTNYFAFIFFLLLSVTAKAAGHTVTITVNQQASCFGSTNGQATANVSGGSGTFTYLWDDGAGTTSAVLSNVGAGTYTVIVTDQADMSTETANCIITEPNEIIVTPTNDSPFCIGETIHLYPNTIPGATYSWMGPNGFTSTSQSPTIMSAGAWAAGVYHLTITVGGCSETGSTTVVNGTATPTFAPYPSPVCQGTVLPPLSFVSNEGYTGTWNPAGGVTTASPGTYQYFFTPSSGQCAGTYTFSITVLPSPVITLTDDFTMCAGLNGLLTASGATNFTWSPPDGLSATSGASITCSPATTTTYTVEGTTSICTSIQSVTVTVSNELSIDVPDFTLQICDGQATELEASVSVVEPVIYTWSPATGLNTTTGASVVATPAVGSYTYTVNASAGGCTGTEEVHVIVNPTPVITYTVDGPHCPGVCDASIQLAGGSLYTCMPWSSGFPNAVCPGTYYVVGTSPNGCVGAGITIVVEESPIPALEITTSTVSTTACAAADGSVHASVDGGTGNYTYLWEDAGGIVGTTQTVTGLDAGNYHVTVTDNMGCNSQGVASVSDAGMTVEAISTVVNCGAGGGFVIAEVTGGSGNITYFWEPGNQTTQSIYNLTGGQYGIAATDENGCTGTATVTVPGALVLSLDPTFANCGMTNGSIVANAEGGNAPYKYSLSTSNFQTSNTFSNLAPGTYTVWVKDAANCISHQNVTVMNGANNLTAHITHSGIDCLSTPVAQTVAHPTNGTAPYTYDWSTDETTATVNLPEGNYYCTITDANGCVATASTTVEIPHMTLSGLNANEQCGFGDLYPSVYGGVPPFTYSWSPGGETTQYLFDLSDGDYTLTVTGANGCAITHTYHVNNASYSYIYGNIFADVNGNCQFDAGDYYLPAIVQGSSDGSTFYGGSPSNGAYSIAVPSGSNSFDLSGAVTGAGSGYYTLADCDLTAVVGECTSTVKNIPFTPSVAQDLKVQLYCGITRAGFDTHPSIHYSNPGTIAQSAVVTYDLDPLLTFIGATPPPTSVSGNHIEWNFANVPPGHTASIFITAYVPTIDNGGTLGTILNNTASISPQTGDLTPANNVSNCSSEITAAYDPNMKEVYSPQAHSSGAIDSAGAEFYYTVHFQNTGTDTAFTIVVRDTLSQYVDISSLEMLSGSHHYTWSLQPGRCLEVRFNNILLVDSNRNEPLSHGYFNYHIKSLPHLPLGAQIDNTAGIYFDFNPPVITNTVSSPIVAFANVEEKPGMEALIYPNPNNTGSVRVKLNGMSYDEIQFQLTDANGRTVRDNQFSHTALFDVDLSGLQNGVYFYTITNEEGDRSTGKLMIVK